MKLIDSSAVKVTTSDPIITAEIAGRTCYKSESPYTLASAFKFLSQCYQRGHLTVLEHAVFHFLLDAKEETAFGDRFSFLTTTKDLSLYGYAVMTINLRTILEHKHYFLLKSLMEYYHSYIQNAFPEECDYALNYCSGNEPIRAVVIPDLDCNSVFSEMQSTQRNNPEDLIGDCCESHFFNTFKVICDRGVSHEFVRHRLFSFCQESTRYCNYSKDKFGKELTFIRSADFDNMSGYDRAILIDYYLNVEYQYMSLVTTGMTPEIARQILPNALKTELVITGSHCEWQHFFDLRMRGTTGKPHPDMKNLAEKIYEIY